MKETRIMNESRIIKVTRITKETKTMKRINLEKALNAYTEYKKAKSRMVYSPVRDEVKLKFDVSTAESNLDEALAEIRAAIKEAEGMSRERTLEPLAVLKWVEAIDGELGIAKTRMKGIKAKVIDGAQSFPRSYKYTPEATAFWMEHNGKSWYMTKVERVPCNYAHKVELDLTDGAKEAIINRISQF